MMRSLASWASGMGTFILLLSLWGEPPASMNDRLGIGMLFFFISVCVALLVCELIAHLEERRL